MTAIKKEELLITAMARLLEGTRHIAVGVSSPIPASAALLTRRLSGGATRVSILGDPSNTFWSDGGKELFDCAAQGRIDAFFFSGAQIDGSGNINLVGIGDYPQSKVRFGGSYGSAFLYYMIPRVILFRPDHNARVLVPKVDFISAAGTSPPEVWRRGGPQALVTGKGVFSFDRSAGRFTLESVHPGETADDIKDTTGFDFDVAADLNETIPPDAETLDLIRGEVGAEIAATYPTFARETLGVAA
ncbi:MAG: CoA-transferase [Alphaproteobacteria bacterium]